MPVRTTTNRRVQPRNTRLVDLAKTGIAATIPLVQQQLENSLDVNGVEALVYNRLSCGRMCSCSIGVNVKSQGPLDEEGNATPEHIQGLLHGATISINRYGAHTKSGVETTEFTTAVPGGNPPPVDARRNTSSDPQDEETNELVDEDDLDLREHAIGAVSGIACGVCYGSGFVGGFQLVSGSRVVIDADYPLATLTKGSVNQAEVPHRVSLLNGEFQFSAVIPMSVYGMDASGVYLGFDSVNELTLLINHPNNSGTWVEFNAQDFATYADGRQRQFKVVGTGEFTHVLFQFNLIQRPVFIEYPRLSLTGDLSTLDSLDSVSLNLSSVVTDLAVWDVVYDSTHDKLWRITNVNFFTDRHLKNLGWDCNARLIQPYEPFFNLPRREAQLRQKVLFNRRTAR